MHDLGIFNSNFSRDNSQSLLLKRISIETISPLVPDREESSIEKDPRTIEDTSEKEKKRRRRETKVEHTHARISIGGF